MATVLKTRTTRTRTTAQPQTGALDMQPPARTTIPLRDTLIWYTRCLDLAEAHRLTATLHGRSVCPGGGGIHLYSVPSSSQPGAAHLVRFHTKVRQVECDCMAARYGRACGHAGAVLIAIDRAERAAAEQNEQWRWWMNTSGSDWDHW